MWITPGTVCGEVWGKLDKKYMKKVINKSVRAISPSYPVQKSTFNPFNTPLSRVFPIIHSYSSNNSFI
jgi:hypothetical protein